MSPPSHPVLVWLPTAIVVAAFMDLWAAVLHCAVWHKALWSVHRSHHVARRGRFEHNDLLSFLHAPIAVGLILYGCAAAPGVVREVLYGAGLGMTAFGVAYAVVHDGLVHRRIPVRALLRVRYFREVVRAHCVHHAATEDGAPFGLFVGPLELARHRRIKRARSRSTERPRAPSDPRS